ncbi:MAG: amino acid adenylation domain-containing protein, partial [Acidobacteria bacterium]|nr:amino acid adenylation domain-containing protein [Acidobacteriota bacterium]
NPVFDVMFSFNSNSDNAQIIEPGDNDGDLERFFDKYEKGTARFDLTLSAGETPDGFKLAIEYCTKLFRKETICRFAGYLEQIISSVVENRLATISEIQLITPQEKKQVLFEFNNTALFLARDKSYARLFVEEAEKTPDRLAAVCGDCQVSFAQLNRDSSCIAGMLLAHGVTANQLVPLYLERSITMLSCIIGVLKSGGAYVPIEVDYPASRVEYILQDCDASLVLTGKKSREMPREITFASSPGKIKEIELLCPAYPAYGDAKLNEKITLDGQDGLNEGDNLAYIIYTSGTTGKPKGVMIHRLGMLNHLYAKIHGLAIGIEDVIAQTASACFDISVWQFLAGLLKGAVTCIIDKETVLLEQKFLQVLEKNRVSIVEIVPSLLAAFLEAAAHEQHKGLKRLRWMIPTGEPLTVSLAREWFRCYPGIKLVNAYGPTEASDDVTHYIVDGIPPAAQTSIPIGKPLPNLHIYILDKHLSLCPVGVRGEICVSGIGVGKGYWKDEEKTKKAFIPNPYLEEIGDNDYARLYKTGDTGYFRPDGHIECLGRIDSQVKIRGFRIELGEIENELLGYPGVKEAVVEVKEPGGEKTICAYIVPGVLNPGIGTGLAVEELRGYLAAKLPAYMIPAYFIYLEKLPLTRNGKIDRAALPGPGDGTSCARGTGYTAPRDEIEAKLVQLWAEILGKDPLHASQLQKGIGIDDNFFQLGGHSLKATVMVSKIHKEMEIMVPLSEIFKTPTIRELSNYIKGKTKEKYESIREAEKKEYYELTSMQKRLYILQQMEPTGTAYNMPEFIPLGENGSQKITSVLKKLIHRHESLRTSFHIIGEQPVQVIHGAIAFEIQYLAAGKKEETGPVIRNFIRPFDLSRAPLMRAASVRIGEKENYLFIDIHHIISDGISEELLKRDFIALYQGEELLPLPIQYKDFAEWQNCRKEKERIQNQEIYWVKDLGGDLPVLNLPLDFPRPLVQDFAGNSIEFAISSDESSELKSFVLREKVTLFIVLLSSFNVLLSKLTGQEDIIIGTPVAGRRHADLENIAGMFVNTLALRNYPMGEKTFRQFIAEVRQRTLGAFENQECRFENLLEKIPVNRDTGRNPLFDVMFVMQNFNITPGNEFKNETEFNNIFQPAKFDFTLTAMENDRGIFFSSRYCIKLFKKETVEGFIIYFKKIVSAVLRDPDLKLHEIEIISKEEKTRILYHFNNTEIEYPGHKLIHQLFAEQAAQTPGYVALHGCMVAWMDGEVARNVSLTYSRLNNQSDRLAGLLIEKGVLADDIIAIKIERSIEMIIGILGILKSGGAYLPIDPGYPVERINYMLRDSAVRILINKSEIRNPKLETNSNESNPNDQNKNGNSGASLVLNFEHLNLNSLKGCPRRGLSNFVLRASNLFSSNLAYVIYTSGSTGKPKGVLIEHRSVVNRLNWMQRCYPLDENDVILQKTNVTFDVSVWELFWWFFNGARLCLLEPGGEKNPAAILKAIAKNKITTIHFVPSMFRVFLDFLETSGHAVNLASLKYIFSSGEALEVEQVTKFNMLLYGRNRTKLINLYGPTEATVDVSYFNCPAGNENSIIPIGKPIDNIR